VDRLWQDFIATHPNQNVTLEQLQSVSQWPYNFFDIVVDSNPPANKPVQLAMYDVLAAISSVDYEYDEKPQLKVSANELAMAKRLQESALISTTPHTLANVKTPAKFHINLPTPLKALAATATSKARTILELSVSYKESPRGRYEVFVNLPEGVTADSKEANKYFAGAISFFVNDPQGKGGVNTFRFDITDELVASDKKDLTVSVVKLGNVAKGFITVEQATVKTLK
jgi:hypothetical protein